MDQGGWTTDVTTIEYCIYRTCTDEYFPNDDGTMKVFATLDEASKFPIQTNEEWSETFSDVGVMPVQCCVFELELTKTWKYLGKNETVVETKVSWV